MSELDLPQKKVFKTYDEEWEPGERIGMNVEKWLTSLDLDTVNQEYAIIVEIHKL